MQLKKILGLSVVLMLVNYSQGFAELYVNQVRSSSVTQVVGGKEFYHGQLSQHGVTLHEYSINRVPVEKKEYIDALESAHLAGIRVQEQSEERKQNDRQQLRDEVNGAILEKLIKTYVQEARQFLQDLKLPVLKPYLVFDPQGLSSETHFLEADKYLENISNGLAGKVAMHDLKGLQDASIKLERLTQQLESCLKQSCRQATSQCSDTAVLKELLKILEK